MSVAEGYAKRFREEREGHSLSQLLDERTKLLTEMHELMDAEELHSFQYAEASWEYDMVHMIIKERTASVNTVTFHTAGLYKGK